MGIIVSILVRHNQQTGWWEVVNTRTQKVEHLAPTQELAYEAADRMLELHDERSFPAAGLMFA